MTLFEQFYTLLEKLLRHFFPHNDYSQKITVIASPDFLIGAKQSVLEKNSRIILRKIASSICSSPWKVFEKNAVRYKLMGLGESIKNKSQTSSLCYIQHRLKVCESLMNYLINCNFREIVVPLDFKTDKYIPLANWLPSNSISYIPGSLFSFISVLISLPVIS